MLVLYSLDTMWAKGLDFLEAGGLDFVRNAQSRRVDPIHLIAGCG